MKPAAWPSQLFGCLLMSSVLLAADKVPRVTFRRGNSSRILTPFSKPGLLSYDTLLLSRDGATLYVGAKEAILSFDISSAQSIKLKGEITWRPIPKKREECIMKRSNVKTDCYNFIRILVALNETHIYACGTNAFNPTCAYIDVKTFTLVSDAKGEPVFMTGKGSCPYNPEYRNTVTIVDGELYTATMNNFQGSEPIISRTLGSRVALKTDSALSWMHGDAVFVASFIAPKPSDDDKVYFFFEETAKEFDFFEKLTVSRVARVCKNDVGGDKVLQRKWTTFLKAQLSCIQPGLFPHAVIQHAFAVPQPGGGAVFYGVFASQWQADLHRSSAVCSFSLDAVKKAFDGKYKDFNKDCFRWTTYNGPVPEPRPGSCSVGSSADRALSFIKEHFLMDEMIEPIDNKPLLVQHGVNYTRIVVHQTPDTSGTLYNVLFLGTDNGFLHKAVVVGSGVHIIEEIQLFGKPEAVQNLLLSPETGVLYVGYSQEVLRVPLANCSAYATCVDCVLARDPYCAWGRGKCRSTRENTADKSAWLQDVAKGKPSLECQNNSRKGSVCGGGLCALVTFQNTHSCFLGPTSPLVDGADTLALDGGFSGAENNYARPKVPPAAQLAQETSFRAPSGFHSFHSRQSHVCKHRGADNLP
ncbi:semaphorin-4A-like [Elgaria multicarinata webbii]|uniref:semaphorin-4A-like n=1 Tax=Elgaria multicarinata webbii TaxID=159646 RepID=UPI002FCCC8DD